jgi:SAM-dependent methyltransferase
MEHTRVRDLGIHILPDGGFLVRAPMRGLAARVPLHAVELLAFCTEPRTRADAEARFGPAGARLYGALAEVGLLVRPEEAHHTSVMFENFASLDVHRRMLGDTPRMRAFADAVRAVVRPGMAVLDAGTGSGILAGLAAQAGARVVYAVDNSDMIDVATEVFRASGFGDRVRPVRADIAQVELPERVDVVVSETFGAMALAEGGLDDVRACVARNLAPGGRVIPEGLSLHLAPVRDRALHDEALGPFKTFEGVDLGVLRYSALHRGVTTVVAPAQLAHAGAAFARVPFPSETPVRGELRLDGVAPGPLYGFVGWFTLHLAPGVDLGTGPADPLTHWKQQLLPVEPFYVDGPLLLTAEVGPAAGDRRGAEVLLRWSSLLGEGQSFHRVR